VSNTLPIHSASATLGPAGQENLVTHHSLRRRDWAVHTTAGERRASILGAYGEWLDRARSADAEFDGLLVDLTAQAPRSPHDCC
jgi:hypothetical protein